MYRALAAVFIACLLHIPAYSAPSPAQPTALPANMETRPVQLSKLAVKFPHGSRIGKAKLGLLCLPGYPLTWRGKRGELSIDEFDDAFRDELKTLGYDVIGSTSDLFETGEESRAEYLIGGTITMMSVNACYPNSGLGDGVSAKGSALLEVQWQLYDRIGRKVVTRVTTHEGFDQKKPDPSGVPGLIISAFGKNVRALAASGELQKYLVGERRDLDAARTPAVGLQPIAMPLATKGVAKLPGAVASTILVQSASGHGSGFLISRDGYFLTNHHVVGGSKYVKLRWSDGVEGVGEVIRKDRGRDVALIKGDPRDRSPLRIKQQTPAVGTDVYAIGAPLDEKLQNTVTKGILSARRFEDGYAFLQSDAAINGGNSGGPLVDANGDVVAITVSSYQINRAPVGISFFIPAHEALEFLAIKAK